MLFGADFNTISSAFYLLFAYCIVLALIMAAVYALKKKSGFFWAGRRNY